MSTKITIQVSDSSYNILADVQNELTKATKHQTSMGAAVDFLCQEIGKRIDSLKPLIEPTRKNKTA